MSDQTEFVEWSRVRVPKNPGLNWAVSKRSGDKQKRIRREGKSTAKTRSNMSNNRHCCGVMESELGRECEDHSDAFDCPDCIVYYSKQLGEYGILIHDGGSSYSVINYCPWCGAKLPTANQEAVE